MLPVGIWRSRSRLEREAPAYLWLAADRGDWRRHDPGPLLERVLEIMGGNRSSFLHTRLDDRGDLRVVPWPDPWRDHARLTLGLARAPLERAAVARALAAVERRPRT